jgi:Fe2+ or Zn2+ uptake regulation protein
MFNIEYMEGKLKEKGYKLTNQRKAIIEVFFENKGTLLSADEIYEKTILKYKSTNSSTVYRNLDVFITSEIIHRININDSSASYELIDDNTHHHLMICKDCGKTQSIEFCPFEEIMSKIKAKNFTLTDHKFELYGYCKKCDKKHID